MDTLKESLAIGKFSSVVKLKGLGLYFKLGMMVLIPILHFTGILGEPLNTFNNYWLIGILIWGIVFSLLFYIYVRESVGNRYLRKEFTLEQYSDTELVRIIEGETRDIYRVVDSLNFCTGLVITLGVVIVLVGDTLIGLVGGEDLIKPIQNFLLIITLYWAMPTYQVGGRVWRFRTEEFRE